MPEPASAQWVRACRDAGSPAPAPQLAAAGARLLRRWAEPHRRYHDRRHLHEVLLRLAELDAEGEPAAADPRVLLAAWFHDAVHRGEPGADERASAELAGTVLTDLGLRVADVRRVAELVLTTAEHAAGDDPGAGALCDADLAVLARDPAGYTAYRQDVREEYAAVPDATFAAGRAAVLQALLDRPQLFSTSTARHRWEKRARRNIAAELVELGARPAPRPPAD